MDRLDRVVLVCALAFVQMTVPFLCVGARELKLEARSVIRTGAHPWYEVKVDPENSRNLIICGTKLDTRVDSLFGFVYASSDGGITWKTALEDRNSLWVTEQSCAFGPKHRAYFISASSKVNNGTPQHEQGTTRLYISPDGGQTWTQTNKTGWADYSTSVVSPASRKLYTFFNIIAGERGRTWGSNVGLLVFSSDGTTIEGPYFDPAIQELDYDGSFPSQAVSLQNGTLAVLYYGTRTTDNGTQADLGILRVRRSEKPLLEHTTILQTVLARDCLRLNDASLVYEQRPDRLFLVYVEGCNRRQLKLLSSDDEGKTWKHVGVIGSYRLADNPSLVLTSDGILGLLWEEGEGSGRWLFSSIWDQKLIEPPVVLSPETAGVQASTDSILTWIYQPNELHGGKASDSAITLNVVNMMNIVWRAAGAVAIGEKVFMVWPSGDKTGMRLYSGVFTPTRIFGPLRRSSPLNQGSDVTEQIVLLYGGVEHFDPTSGCLRVCLKLGNQGGQPIRAPLWLEASDIRSPIGTISIVNATNRRSGTGAKWDISDALTGTQIYPRTASNSFCLSFRLVIPSGSMHFSKPGNLLVLKLRVIASNESDMSSGAH